MMRDKKKLLIAGGGHSDIPLILAGKKLGFYVITTGNQINGPNGLGHSYADEYHYGDYSDKEEILALAKKLKIDAICACCNDFSAISSAYVAEKLGLPGHDSYEKTLILHHKDRYRKFALENNIPTPFAQSYSSVKEALESIGEHKFSLMVKPIDLTGGKGVSKINCKEEYRNAVEKAFSISRAKCIVVEEFIGGSQHTFSAFIRDGKVVFYFGDNEFSYLNPYLVSTSSTPAIVPKTVDKRLIKISETISSILSLKTGLFHIQYLLQGEDPIIIEITRRCPGDLYSYPVNYLTGADYASWIIRAATGMDCSELTYSKPKGYFGRHCVMSEKQGKVMDISFDESIQKNIVDKFMWWKKGDLVNDVLTSKFGIVFLKYDSLEEMINKTNKLNQLIKVYVE
ncbi:MAG: ATP-grasp domain-containing protein [Maledivibacter sp.]|jgi:biotin carboxylase|nr:ATP-grasp domain-containing protein [Maledivibacter sp.]